MPKRALPSNELLPSTLVMVLGLACVVGCGDKRDDGEEDGNREGGNEDIVGDASGEGGSVGGGDEIATFDPDTDDGGDDSGGSGGNCVNPDGSSDNDGDSYDFSVIWIANTDDASVSKVDTRMAVELARYRTSDVMTANPSRTSVNLRGDVAVANRGTGTIVKIAAREEDCLDRNNDGMIRTSTGPGDVLPFGEDECVLWVHDVGFRHQGGGFNEGGTRALAWEAGGDNPDDPCALKARLWASWRDWNDGGTPHDASSPTIVRRILPDGETDDEVEIDAWQGGKWQHGVYGAAADVHGNFWGIGSQGFVVRVDAEDLSVKTWQRQSQGSRMYDMFYGIALDGQGNPWLTDFEQLSLVKFDLETEKFIEIGKAPVPDPAFDGTFARGLVVDEEYNVWMAISHHSCGVARYEIVEERWHDYIVPGGDCQTPVGTSIDHEGFVWIVDQGKNSAYKLSPEDLSVQTVTGFIGPYTYSDMTGSGLKLVNDQVDPPARR